MIASFDRDDGEYRMAHWRRLLVGVALLLLGPTVLWPISRWIGMHVSDFFGFGLTIVGGIAFAVGWISVTTSLLPSGGVRLAITLYLMAGTLWVLTFVSIVLPRQEASISMSMRDAPLVLLDCVLWPLHMAFTLGLFGFETR